jgi:hypothetical protein
VAPSASAASGSRDRYYDSGISIPSACSVKGIEARLDWWLTVTAGTSSMSVELSWDSGASWTAAETDTVVSTTEHTTVLGSSTDTWGRTWTLAELSNANFGLRLTCDCSGFLCTYQSFYLDWVPVKVYYGP